ncbi:phage portal protein [Corynebacterium sp. USCH3]|uniref:phage portal protein n=1 Tax=Corynebacterium sp. USCH3 TaxID=3024840 RepID=UPI0030B23ABC
MTLPADDTAWPPAPWQPLHDMVADASVWWEGDTRKLQGHYAAGSAPAPRPSQFAGGLVGATSRLFWGKPQTPGQRQRKLHLPLAADIANLSANLMFETPPQVHLAQKGKTDDGEPIRAGNDKAQERLDLLVNNDEAAERLLVAAESSAALGGVYGRVMWDTSIQPEPWIDWVDTDSAIPEWKYGKLAAVAFVEGLPTIDKKFVHRLLSRHSPGRIEYALYEGKDDNLGRRIPLAEHPSTEGLAGIVDAESGIQTGTQRMTAVYVANVRPVVGFRKDGQLKQMGRPDIPSDSYGLLDMLDEVWTDLRREIRTAKSRIVVTESMLDIGKPGQGAEFDMDREIYSAVGDTPDGMSPEFYQPDIRVAAYAQVCEMIIREILRRANVSSLTFGLDNAGGSGNVTAREIEANSRATLQTFKAKSRYWRAGIGNLTAALVDVDAHLNHTGAVLEEVPEVDITPPVQETDLDRAQTLQALDSAQAISTDQKVRYLRPDWDEKRIGREIDTVLKEKGIQVGDPFGDAAPDEMVTLEDQDTDSGVDADELKKRADAMGSMIRAGVDPEDAARRSGFIGTKFTGGRPITMRYADQE